jgi:hypothetical protein
MRTWNKWIRHIHRWLVVPFVLALIYLFINVLMQGESFLLPIWLNIMAIGSLFALLFTGLYMFGHHYWLQWRRKVGNRPSK